MTSPLTFHDLLKTYGVEPSKVRMVRCGNKEIPVLEVFHNDKDRFTEYTAWQKPGKYGDAEYLAIFSPARGTTSLFLGIWRIRGVTQNRDLAPNDLDRLRKSELPEGWYKTSDHYHLNLTEIMFSLSERLVIEWGKSTLNWVQSQNKSVVQIKP